MPLESATYIEQLVDTNPAGTDQVSQGDDHIRLIKSCIQDSFPNTNGVWNTTSPITAGPATLGGQLMQLQQQRKIASGVINSNGARLGGTGDYSVVKGGTGVYTINFTDAAPGQYEQALTATASNLGATACNTLINSPTQIQVITTATVGGAAVDAIVSFNRVIT